MVFGVPAALQGAGASTSPLPSTPATLQPDGSVLMSHISGPVADGVTLFSRKSGLKHSEFGAWTRSTIAGTTVSGDEMFFASGARTTALPKIGTVKYKGTAVIEAGPVYIGQYRAAAKLYGTVALTVDFSKKTVTGSITRVAGTTSPARVMGDMTVVGGGVTAGAFSGQTAVLDKVGTNVVPMSGTTGTIAGAVYGPNAAEVAGTFRLVSGQTSALILGSFGAKR